MSIRRASFILLTVAVAAFGAGARAQNVLILTDNSSAALNGATHVSDLVAAFTNTGASVTTNTTELTNGSAMAASVVQGRDVVVVVTVTGLPIDAADVPVIQSAVSSQASRVFQFFTDACNGCTRGSATALLPITNAVGGWTASLGTADNTYPYTATLNGSGTYNAAFTSLPSILAGAYSPFVGVPVANVIYDANAAVDGPMAVVAPSSGGSSCVFHASDTTQFWKTGGAITAAQANALAAAYVNAATSSTGPCEATVPATPATWTTTKAIFR